MHLAMTLILSFSDRMRRILSPGEPHPSGDTHVTSHPVDL
jgi:hypothetical protein